MTLYRNTSTIDSFYRTQTIFNWEEVCTNEKNFSFDEWPGISTAWLRLGLPYYDELCMDDIWTGRQGLYPTKMISEKGYSPYNDNLGHTMFLKKILFTFTCKKKKNAIEWCV